MASTRLSSVTSGVDTVVIGDIFGELFDALDRSFEDVDAAIMLMPLMPDEIYE